MLRSFEKVQTSPRVSFAYFDRPHLNRQTKAMSTPAFCFELVERWEGRDVSVGKREKLTPSPVVELLSKQVDARNKDEAEGEEGY